MNEDELLAKLAKIEEQANLTLTEFSMLVELPKTLTRERQRMIIAFVKCIRGDLRSGKDVGTLNVPVKANSR
jgi:hypothetical protein